MNCMALELPCAPLGHILDTMFSPRSLNTAVGRPVRCKFTGVYVPSSSTPMLTSWSKNTPEDTGEDLASVTSDYCKLDVTDEILDSDGPSCEDTVDLDSDSGHSSDISGDDLPPDSRCLMPLASEDFEIVMLELKEEEEANKLSPESDNSLSDCSDDSFDFGVHTVYSESPTLDRAQSRDRESECFQLCCRRGTETCTNTTEQSEHNESCANFPRGVRFADHVRLPQRHKISRRSTRLTGNKTLKPILKSSSIFH